ncbi:hypothetical protein A1OO_07700 [Enterovibrio norvegicus FF-33]|nr:hypothetical protein A1OO_07700 [Enterovibrio norvegicus FF-33]
MNSRTSPFAFASSPWDAWSFLAIDGLFATLSMVSGDQKPNRFFVEKTTVVWRSKSLLTCK